MVDFFEFSNEMLCIANFEGYFTRVNAAWTHTLGWTARELTNRPYIDFVHPDDLEATLREADLLATGNHETIWFENRYRRVDGTYRWLAWRVTVELAQQQVVASARDITDRKQMEEALRDSEQRFRAFMDNSPTAWAKDAEGRIVYLNRTAEEKLGLSSRVDWYLKTDFDFWPAENARRLQENDRRVLATGETERFLEETEVPGGLHIHWMTILFPYNDRAGRRYVGGIAVDITDLKRAEAALVAEQDLMRNLLDLQEREKQHLCHEFHDGLIQYAVGAMMSLQGAWRKELSPTAAAQVDAVIEKLRQGIDDGRRAIRGIRPAVLDEASLQAALEDLIDQFRQTDILIRFDCDATIGVVSKDVQTCVYRVVQEALNNAHKYSGTDVVRVKLEQVGDSLHLEVRDFGCGFDVAAARHQGFGLFGMTKRARLLGGTCRIDSVLTMGTTISMQLPLTSSN
ncbi:MAG: hypothetical protein C0483_12390 [Pirellula sp.]|nr:hypothetical protein [Pirellula sp.]